MGITFSGPGSCGLFRCTVTDNCDANLNNSEQFRFECEAKAWNREKDKRGFEWWRTYQRPRLIQKRGADYTKRLEDEMRRLSGYDTKNTTAK